MLHWNTFLNANCIYLQLKSCKLPVTNILLKFIFGHYGVYVHYNYRYPISTNE
jgi:hypothetical protein